MQIVKCNFSGIYRQEDFMDGTVLVFSGLEETRCYCSRSSADIIRAALAPYGPGGLHWLDSGDYHYVSLFIQEMIDEPYSLVLFDHHPDDQEGAFGEDLLSCGGWVAEARDTLPMLKETVWIREAVRETALPDLPVYLSIDKDVLSGDYARTNWDQGTMTLPQLKDAVRAIASRHEILGIDVCGELSSAKGAFDGDYAINRAINLELQDFFLSLQTQ